MGLNWEAFLRFIVIYRRDTILSLMGRLFGWGGRPSQEQKANPSLIDDEAFFSTSSITSLGLCELGETLMLS